MVEGQHRALPEGIREEITMSAVVCFGEVMLRLTPPGYTRFAQAKSFDVAFGGAENNVAVSLACFGEQSRMVTKMPENAIADMFMREMRAVGVDTRFVVRGGERVGIYYVEKGASLRPTRVTYDRRHSAMTMLVPSEIDWDAVFEDADWLHWTGITAAISPTAPAVILEALKAAKRHGVTVSCDLNYRKNLWTPEQAQQVMPELVEYTDVIIGTVEDSALTVGVVPEGVDIEKGRQTDEDYFKTAQLLARRFNAPKVAMMERESISSNDCNWFMKLYDAASDTMAHSREYAIHIQDNVGCGDAFGAGLIYALRAGMSDQEAVEFGTAAGALKHTINGDYNLITRDEVLAIVNGGATGRVQR